MKNNQVLEVFEKLKIPCETEQLFTEIKSIHLDDGRIIVPNYLYNRFVVNKSSLGIIYGESKAIGGRFPFNFSCNQAQDTIIFQNNTKIPDTIFYENLSFPKMGDVIRISEDISNYEEFRVLDVFSDMFNTHIKLGGSCKKLFPGTSKISFYTDSNVDQKRCVFGTIEEGIYLEFVPNEFHFFKDNMKVQ